MVRDLDNNLSAMQARQDALLAQMRAERARKNALMAQAIEELNHGTESLRELREQRKVLAATVLRWHKVLQNMHQQQQGK